MMGDIGALVVRNDLGLEPEKVKELSRLVQKGSISYLSPEREATPFMLYMTGQDLAGIALRTNLPVDIILLTAMRYNWPAKAAEMKKSMVDGDLASIKADIVKMLLVATHTSIQKELADLLSGNKDGKKSELIPRNIRGLKDLMDLVDGLGGKAEGAGSGGINVNGGTVQINLSSSGQPNDVANEFMLDIPKSKIPKDLLKGK